MPPKPKFVVAQCYRGWRSIGSRRFSSPARSDGSLAEKAPGQTPLVQKESFNFFGIWFLSGLTAYFAWDMYRLKKVEQRIRRDKEFDAQRDMEMDKKIQAVRFFTK